MHAGVLQEDPSGLVVSTAATAEDPIASQFTVFAPINTALRTAVTSTTPSAELVEVSCLTLPTPEIAMHGSIQN